MAGVYLSHLVRGQDCIHVVLHACAQQRQLAVCLALSLGKRSRRTVTELRGLDQVVQRFARFAPGLHLLTQRRRRGVYDGEHLVLLVIGQRHID